MGSVYNPTTQELHRSVHTPDYINNGWVHVDETTATLLQQVPRIYRQISGPMTTAEIDAIDTSLLPSIKRQHLQALRIKVDAFLEDKGYDGIRLANIVNLLDMAHENGDSTEITRIRQITDIINQIETDFETAKTSVEAATTRAGVESIVIDLSPYDDIPGEV